MEDKIRRKIRKLLALSTSDNEHESTRAREQAKKLMSAHNISEEGLDIVLLSANETIKRKILRRSEVFLVSAIEKISGCAVAMRGTRHYGAWETKLEFLGEKHLAEIACYTWDTLYPQMNKAIKAYKSENSCDAGVCELFARSWAASVHTKILDVFPILNRSPQVASDAKRRFAEYGSVTPRDTKISTTQRDADDALAAGNKSGKNAKLFVAAGHQQVKSIGQ